VSQYSQNLQLPSILKNILAVFVLRRSWSRLRRDENTKRPLSEFPSASNLIIASDRHSVPLLTDPCSRSLNWHRTSYKLIHYKNHKQNQKFGQPPITFSLTSSENSRCKNYAPTYHFFSKVAVPKCFPTKIMRVFLVSAIRVTCLTLWRRSADRFI
jgi:hypothetical protein